MNVLDLIKVTALAAALLNLVLTFLVLAWDTRSTLNRVYMLWGIAVACWNMGVYHLSEDISPAQAFKWAKILQLGVLFMPVIMAHLCAIILQSDRIRRLLPYIYLVHIGFAASIFCNAYIVGVRRMDVGYWSKPGPFFFLFGYWYSLLTTGLVWALYRSQKRLASMQRKRVRSLLWANVGLWIFGSNDLLPILGHDKYPFTDIKFFPLGSIAALFYVVIVGYSVLQHRLLDIHLTLSRFAAQFVRLSFMMMIGFTLLLIASRLRPDQFSMFSFGACLAALLLSAVAASLLFPKFFGKGSDQLERRILGDHFEYHARTQSFIAALASFPEPDYLLPELEDLLVRTIRARGFQVVLVDDNARAFTLFHACPPQPGVTLTDWQVGSPVFRYFQEERAKFLSCNLLYETSHETTLQRQAREQVKAFEPEFCFPFFAGEDLIGLLVLGPKANGDPYSPYDLRLLTELSASLGLALNQIRLRDQLQVAHEQDLLGRMSRGLAHDLNNLLTPVQTLLQLLQESAVNQDTINELLPMGLRNLETVRTYVNEALFFSANAKLHGRPGLFNEAVREAVALIKAPAEEKGIAIVLREDHEARVEMDAVLIKRLICNLLSNAVDASPSGSQIEVELSALPKTELNRDWHRLKVIDRGEGISPENLQRVFTPYFTTKNTGDGKRGFGLGLAIARKIVHLHGGNLSISSKLKKGTTVQVDLPSKLNASQELPPATQRQELGMAVA
jgi:signal transduction histidine kinase